MNTLIKRPTLTSPALREAFDNKILLVFLTIIAFLIILGLLFIDLIRATAAPLPPASI